MASHNDLPGSRHISAFPDQPAITSFLRSLLKDGRTQVTWASDAKVPYNSLTNWFAAEAPKMSAVNFLRLVIAARAEKDLATWLAKHGGTWHNVSRPDNGVSEAEKRQLDAEAQQRARQNEQEKQDGARAEKARARGRARRK